MKDFQFHRPTTIAEAVAMISSREDAKFLSGGQSLLPVIKLDLAEPSDLISLSGLKELADIRVDGAALLIGAMATHDAVSRSAEVRKHIPGLAALAAGIGDPQVRNRGTIGGSVAHADPSADYPAALVALGATIITSSRRVLAEDFFTGLFESCLERSELVTAVRFPVPSKAAYAKFAHRASKYAVVGVMVAVTASGIRVAVTGAGSKVFRVASMEAALTKEFSVSALDAIVMLPDDLNGDSEASAEYRAHLIGVMAKRAVAACLS
jgi:aerobic carbon-monoxide dehydrogenase medium subunit